MQMIPDDGNDSKTSVLDIAMVVLLLFGFIVEYIL